MCITLPLPTPSPGVRRAARGRDEAARPPRAGRRPRYISLHLPTSPYISLHLPISHYISLYLTCAATSSRPTASTASPTGPRRSRSEACELDGEMGRDRLRSTTSSTELASSTARSPELRCLAPSSTARSAELDDETRCELDHEIGGLVTRTSYRIYRAIFVR